MKVDNREPQWVKDAFPDATVEQLEIGDIATNNTIIERKEINDLASSIIDGRYKNQIATLIGLPSFFIIVGSLDKLNYYNKKRTGVVASAITHIPIKYRIPLFHVENNSEFIATVNKIIDKRKDLELDMCDVHKQKFDKHLRVLCSLPGISKKRAKVIRKEYDSILDAINCIEDWGSLDGIGQKTIDNCREVLY